MCSHARVQVFVSLRTTDLDVVEHGDYGKQEEQEEGGDVTDDHQLADPAQYNKQSPFHSLRQLCVHYMEVLHQPIEESH